MGGKQNTCYKQGSICSQKLRKIIKICIGAYAKTGNSVERYIPSSEKSLIAKMVQLIRI